MSKENLRKRSGNVLTFDVDPNDPSLFSHCVSDEKKGDEQYETTPLPPPNSRPSSTKSKSSQVQLVVSTKDGSTREDNSNKKSEVMNSGTGYNTANKFNEDDQVAEKTEKTDSTLKGGSSAHISVQGDQISVQKDQN